MTESTSGATSLDRIVLRGLEAKGYHGVFPEERAEGQLFRVDLELAVDTRAAAASDDLNLTVDYGAVAQRAVQLLTGPPVNLIETVAAQIAQATLEFPGVAQVTVTLHKPFAPVGVPVRDITVTITRTRESAPQVPASPAPASPAVISPDPVPQVSATEPRPAAGTLIPDLEEVAALAPSSGTVAAPTITPALEPDPIPTAAPQSRESLPAKLTTEPLNQVGVVLSFGSNLGDRQRTLQSALYELDQHPKIQVVSVSPLAATDPVGGPEQGEYLNAVALISTGLSPIGLLDVIHEVEAKHGRVRAERWGPRTLDIDIIDYQGMIAVSEVLDLPHPRAAERAFVLAPWAALAPEAQLVGLGGGPVAQLAQTSPDLPNLRWVAQNWLQQPQAW